MKNYFDTKILKWIYLLIMILSISVVFIDRIGRSENPFEYILLFGLGIMFFISNLLVFQRVLLIYYSKKNCWQQIKTHSFLRTILVILEYCLIVCGIFIDAYEKELGIVVIMSPLFLSTFFGDITYIGDKIFVIFNVVYNFSDIKKVKIKRSVWGTYVIEIVNDITKVPKAISIRKKYVRNYISQIKALRINVELDDSTAFDDLQ